MGKMKKEHLYTYFMFRLSLYRMFLFTFPPQNFLYFHYSQKKSTSYLMQVTRRSSNLQCAQLPSQLFSPTSPYFFLLFFFNLLNSPLSLILLRYKLVLCRHLNALFFVDFFFFSFASSHSNLQKSFRKILIVGIKTILVKYPIDISQYELFPWRNVNCVFCPFLSPPVPLSPPFTNREKQI